jgi:transcriptional regulator with XRE-family HTH domain
MAEQIIAERIRLAREKMGITMTEAARRLNLSKIGYCRYEYGDRTPSLQTIELIAQCFETSVDYLLGKTSDPAPDYIVIHKDKNPELFEIIRNISVQDNPLQKRLLEYYKKIQKQ